MRQRLAAHDRRQAILVSVLNLFATKGFDGVTTRELAKAANVSEALLYRHFPSKEALYGAMRVLCVAGKTMEGYDRVVALEPSASTLVLLTQFLVSKMLFKVTREAEALDLLFIRSFLGDGDFARAMHRDVASVWHDRFRKSLEAAAKAGETNDAVLQADMAPWLAQCVSTGLMLFLRPKEPIVDVKLSRPELMERCVRFILLGVGLKAEVVRKHYNPKGLALLGAA